VSSLFGIAAGGTSDFYPFKINGSCRFDVGSSVSLLRNFPDNGDSLTTWTWSAWIKRSDMVNGSLFTANFNSNQIGLSTDRITFEFFDGTNNNFLVTTRKLRDNSSWYNIVCVWNTTDSTSSNRMRIYINGTEETTFDSSSYPTQNRPSKFNTGIQHNIGNRVNPSASKYDGYIAEMNFIDGQALTPSSFGETKNGVWIPKDTSGLTFGSNGFRLEFRDDSDIGADTSGENHDFTNSSGLAASDVTPDSPTNNFPTQNANGTESNGYTNPRHGNLEVDTSNTGRGTTFSTMAMIPGTGQKYYAEMRLTSGGGDGFSRFGIIDVAAADQYTETNNWDAGTNTVSYTNTTGKIAVNGSAVETVATYTNGDVIGIAVDLENGTCQFSKNGSNVGSAVSQSFISSNSMLFAASDSSNSADCIYNVNYGQDSSFAERETAASNLDASGLGTFHHAVPSGFKALCAENMPEPTTSPNTSDQPEHYFEANLWTGNGSSQSISSYEFSPDWVWIKERSSTSSHMVYDTIRGTDVFIQTNSTVANTSSTTNLTSFDSNGFSLGSGGSTNQSSQTYVGWAWKAGGTPTATNSAGAGNAPTSGSVMKDGTASTTALAGTIPAKKMSINTETGFSMVTYEGTGSNGTIAHGLNSAPQMVWYKRIETDGTNWAVFHEAMGNTTHLVLNTTADDVTSSSMFNNTSPTSTTISVGTSSHTNTNEKDYIAYCFHSVDGFSHIGSYKGDGGTDGRYVYCGFRPAFVIIKTFSSTNRWVLHDNKRSPFNAIDEAQELNPNDDADETTSTTECLDFLANGFKLKRSGNVYNTNGHNYIYMALAEMPFKYANAR